MGKRIYLTEQQFNSMMSRAIIEESIFEASTIGELKSSLKNLAAKGIIITSSIIVALAAYYNLPEKIEKTLENEFVTVQNEDPWVLSADDVLATVYNAKKEQCNDDFDKTSSMFRLNLDDVASHKIIAMERTFMKELGLKYGDMVKIEGTGKYDGEYQVQDVMNKRFAGQHKIDILVPNNITLGSWENVKIYKLRDESMKDDIKSKMSPQLSREDSMKQSQRIAQEIKQKAKIKAQKKNIKKNHNK